MITGISQPAADSVYDIPSYIDGKKVIAIVANAFSGSNAKTVYVPTTVKTIWNYAFADVLLNVMLTGKHPTEMFAKGRAGRIVRKCTALNPDDRYQSAEKLTQAL